MSSPIPLSIVESSRSSFDNAPAHSQTRLVSLLDLQTSSTPKPPSHSFYKTTPLLSRIYCHLTSHVHSGSSIHLQAALAWILDRTSTVWLDKVGQWVGLLPEEGEETERDGWEEVGAERVEVEKGVVDYEVSSERGERGSEDES